MPFNTRLNMSSVGVGLPRKQFGTRLFGGQEDLRGSDVGPQTGTLPFMSSSQPEVQTPTKNKDDSGDGLDWFSLLAPVISTGLGYLAGGKAGALYGASFGANAGASFVETKEERKRYREKMSQEQQKIGIQETEAATRSAAVENEALARSDALRQRKIEKAVTLGIFDGLDPEDKAEAKKRYQAKKAADFSDVITKVETSDELPAIRSRIDSLVSTEELSAEDAKTLKAQADGREKALKEIQQDKKTLRTAQQENIASSIASRNANDALRTAENARQEQERIEARTRNVLNLVRGGLSYTTIKKNIPDIDETEYNEIKGQDAYDKTFERFLGILGRNVIPGDEASIAKVREQAEREADAARAKYISGGSSGYDEAKVSKAVSDRKGKSSPDDIEHLKEAVRQGFYTQQEANEIANRLGLSWQGATVTPARSDTTTSIDSEMNALFKKK